jgi:hypothetical protein
MAYYAKDITFAIGNPAKSDMDALHSSVRRINGAGPYLWFGIKENLKELSDGPILDYYETVSPEEAIRRYENNLKTDQEARINLFSKSFFEQTQRYEGWLYDRRTVAVTYWETDVDLGGGD